NHSADRPFVSYLPEPELRRGGVPGEAARGTPSRHLRVVRDVLSAAGGRTDRAPSEPAPPVLRTALGRLRPDHGRARPDALGILQEDRDRGPARRRRDLGLRSPGESEPGVPDGRHRLLRLPDLLRLLGILGYRDRLGAGARLPAHGELPPSLRLGIDRRILEAVAHLAVD